MEMAVAVVAGLLLVTWWVSRVNARYEARRNLEIASGDARVEEAWEAWGAMDDLVHQRASLEALLHGVSIATLREKTSLVQLTIMAVRAEAYDVLEALGSRAAQIAAGCGEGLAVRGIAEAYVGDDGEAMKLLNGAREALAGCATCGGTVDAKVLLQEVAIARDAVVGA